jgi:hypothetical protein
MASADFSDLISSPHDDNSTTAKPETSPGNALEPSHLYSPHLQLCFPGKYWALKIFAFSSNIVASYVIPVRRVSALSPASFRSYLTIDTLAVQLMIPLTGLIEDLSHKGLLSEHLQVQAPCRAHKKKRPLSNDNGLFYLFNSTAAKIIYRKN